jgi:hypothetical protein
VVLRWCYSVLTVVLQWCYNGVTVVVQCPTMVLQWCYSGITVVLHLANGQVVRMETQMLVCLQIIKYEA